MVYLHRSRPYRKNDNCFVEQKNWPVVRQQVGYLRYDTPAELEVLRELYGHLRLYVNFFPPQMKLIEKAREGAKVRKRFDIARTPYRRVLASPHVSPKAKEALSKTRAADDLVDVVRRAAPARSSCPTTGSRSCSTSYGWAGSPRWSPSSLSAA